MTTVTTLKSLPLVDITLEKFQPYGQLITPSRDGQVYDESDAQLHLKNGTPRFYIMRLKERGRQFHRITRHEQCTQCLGALEGKEWFLGVAPASSENFPNIEQLQVFRIPGDCFIKLDVGTWHAGPYFDHDFVDFYNLELSDTNVVDHFTYDFLAQDNLKFEIAG
ncbi:ureidoglycolate lyase [Crocosphaera sp. Alani8]|uniref:ureidoglycolate lyase n=1 Tax=Crocosphaera sp. Alani8 TaxID=3038952 RepID=UPI00313B3406